MRIIDADALMEQIRLMANRSSLGEISLPSIGGLEITGLILSAPTLDIIPVIHSKWVFSGYEGEPWCECLNCGFVPSKKAYKESHKCCSECGAIMDEK